MINADFWSIYDQKSALITKCALAAVAVVLAACSTAGSLGHPVEPADPPPASSATAPPAPAPAGPTALLADLAVKGRAPKTGYDRVQFGPAWTDDNDDEYGHNGCDTRNDILRRDLNDITLDPSTHGCVVLAGRLSDPYTGKTIMFTRGATTSA